MMPPAIDQGRQTDAAVADHSKRDQEGFIRQYTLGRMMIRHLANQQGAFFPSAFKDDELFAFGNAGVGELGAGIGYDESSKEVGAFQHGPPGIERHCWFSMAFWTAFRRFRCNGGASDGVNQACQDGTGVPGGHSISARKAQLIPSNLMVMLDIVKGE